MIFKKIRTIIAKTIKIDENEVTLEKNLIEDLNADSIEIYSIAYAIEDEFGIENIDDDVQFLRTVKDVVEYIERVT